MSRRPAPVLALALAVAAAACGATPPSPTTGSSAAGRTLPTATGTPRPTLEPTPVPQWLDAAITHPAPVNGFASQAPGYFCDPCHNLAEDNLFGVAAVAGGYIATGAVTPPASAIALWSPDGMTWTPLPGFSSVNGSAAVAVAQSGARIVLVGHDSSGAAAWAGDNGTWSAAPAQSTLLVSFAAGGMTSVVPFDGGFVGAGYRDDPLHLRAAGAVWRSADGLSWSLDADGGAFGGARILGLAAVGDTLVAVGTAGDLIKGPAAAWRWTRGSGWQPAEVPAGGGSIGAVLAWPRGLVAVGVNASDTGAMAWTSADGVSWQAAPDQAAFQYYGLPVRLQALTLVGGTWVAAGWRSDPGKGSSVAVTSEDGRTWSALPWQASFSGGEIDALATSGGTLVAAGRVGYPDDDKAAVWVRNWP